MHGGWSGEGNINVDPLFADPDTDDFHLQADSPCIDAADGSWAPDKDMEDNARHDAEDVPNTGTGSPPYADMGAYEYQG